MKIAAVILITFIWSFIIGPISLAPLNREQLTYLQTVFISFLFGIVVVAFLWSIYILLN